MIFYFILDTQFFLDTQTNRLFEEVLKNPEMMKTAMAAAGDGPEAEMMKKMTENPQMMLV